MKGIILHGGHGTRLRPLTHTGPKQLLPIANKPMSNYCVDTLIQAGIKEIAFIIGGIGSQKVKEFYGNGDKFGAKFSYIEHADNISLALDVCEELGISKSKALEGMLKANPDPGALKIVKFNNSLFINAFAANDPESTVVIWDMIKGLFEDKKS